VPDARGKQPLWTQVQDAGLTALAGAILPDRMGGRTRQVFPPCFEPSAGARAPRSSFIKLRRRVPECKAVVAPRVRQCGRPSGEGAIAID